MQTSKMMRMSVVPSISRHICPLHPTFAFNCPPFRRGPFQSLLKKKGSFSHRYDVSNNGDQHTAFDISGRGEVIQVLPNTCKIIMDNKSKEIHKPHACHIRQMVFVTSFLSEACSCGSDLVEEARLQ